MMLTLTISMVIYFTNPSEKENKRETSSGWHKGDHSFLQVRTRATDDPNRTCGAKHP